MTPTRAEASFRKGRPFIFFASRMPGMESLREKIHASGEDREIPVWLAGYSNPELNHLPLEEVQIACMDRVRRAERFVCVLNGSYGAPLELTELCILELEIFAAVRDAPGRCGRSWRKASGTFGQREATPSWSEPFESWASSKP